MKKLWTSYDDYPSEETFSESSQIKESHETIKLLY